jgi:hypothetical protein
LLRFYTPADKPKSFFDLFRIESVHDYVESIESLEIDLDLLAAATTVHSDYEFIENYLSTLIRKASRVVFLGVYDFSKEVYFVNRFSDKEFVVGDVSASAIQSLEQRYKNIRVIESTFEEFKPENGDLVVINIAEYFMSKCQMLRFIEKGGEVVLNNAHIYRPSFSKFVGAFLRESRALVVNLMSLGGLRQQWQFRGWWRTESEYLSLARSAGKSVKTIKTNPKRTFGHQNHSASAAMVHIGLSD